MSLAGIETYIYHPFQYDGRQWLLHPEKVAIGYEASNYSIGSSTAMYSNFLTGNFK